jgi:hypothetical protein
MKKVIIVTVFAVIAIIAIIGLSKWLNFDSTLFAGLLSVVATIVSPFLVISISEFLADQKDIRNRKVSVFKVLMTTRGDNLTKEHVNALNYIDLEFDSDNALEKEVLDAWQLYHHHLGEHAEMPTWNQRREDLYAQLMLKMAKSLGFEFNETRIKTGYYKPNQFFKEQEIKDNLLGILRGDKPIMVKAYVGE